MKTNVYIGVSKNSWVSELSFGGENKVLFEIADH